MDGPDEAAQIIRNRARIKAMGSLHNRCKESVGETSWLRHL